MKKAKGKSAEPAPGDKSNSLTLKTPVNGSNRDRIMCDLVSQGIATNAFNAMTFARANVGALSLTDMVESLQAGGQAVNRNDLAAPERMLYAQAVTLNAIFTEMARRAALNMGECLDATDRYMRLGLKAQAQCRTTIEALHEMKNPRPVAFVQQANIAHGAQQVINGAVADSHAIRASAQAGARPGENSISPNEQSGRGSIELPTDTGTTQGAGGANTGLGALETVYRAENGEG